MMLMAAGFRGTTVYYSYESWDGDLYYFHFSQFFLIGTTSNKLCNILRSCRLHKDCANLAAILDYSFEKVPTIHAIREHTSQQDDLQIYPDSYLLYLANY
jgi:hypothetical protein